MKRSLHLNLGVALTLALPLACAVPQESGVLQAPQDRVSYALGVDLARNFINQEIEFNPEILLKGLTDATTGGKLLLPEAEVQKIIREVQTSLIQRRKRVQRTPGAENLFRGEAFLARNRTNAGVTTLNNGLQYLALKSTEGQRPTIADTVEINYRGTQLDGAEFISSKPDQPARFRVKDAFVRGLVEALPLMPAGSKWRLFLPPQLAYGENGVGRSVGPNATVIFEVELLAIR